MEKKSDPKALEQRIKDLERMVQALKENEAVLHEENSELKKIKLYYDALMQNTEDFVVICDSDGIPQAFNRSYKETAESLYRAHNLRRSSFAADHIRNWSSTSPTRSASFGKYRL